MNSDESAGNELALRPFHPLIQKWFTNKFGLPTDVQKKVWPQISKGHHLLITAPTGCGKTLSAFLWGLNQLIAGEWSQGAVRILYVSPLKALNSDIKINLLTPLRELMELFGQEGEAFPDIDVQTRSGDTPASTRQRMLRRPPEILITTPESLNLILSSIRGRALLKNIVTVILDEIHAVASNKRGTHLITAVDRLVSLTGEFQRIALSATVKPVGLIADFVAGYRMDENGDDTRYVKREIKIIESLGTKKYDVQVCTPLENKGEMFETLRDAGTGVLQGADVWWDKLVAELRRIIETNRSTLIFANSRRFVEKLTRLINEAGDNGAQLAYSHHGSLSKEIRNLVEQKLKRGELKAIVATSSLELGIDIGKLDEVIIVQAPFSVSSAFQRVGRAGHSVRAVSRARMYPLFAMDFLNSAVMAQLLMAQNIEEANIPASPLDVLAQIIISMTGVETWDIDELFRFIKTSYPYHELGREQYDLVLQMLAGRYADTRIRELQPRITIDRLNNCVKGREGVLRYVYMAGGTIPDRGYFHLRVQETGAKIGELDEEFVWERSIGDTFVLGTQYWKIRAIDYQNVQVVPAGARASMAPFWKGEFNGRDFHFSEKITLFLERMSQKRLGVDAVQLLQNEYYMDDSSARYLVNFLNRQKDKTGPELPHRHHLIAEYAAGQPDSSGATQIILHTLWGGKINRPYSIALGQAFEDQLGIHPKIYHDDDCVFIGLPPRTNAIDMDQILSLVTPQNAESLLRKKLEQTGFFGARFRESAARALLLPKKGFNRRSPLWINRLRSKKLLGSILRFEDFPILTETWRTCLKDEFDIPNLLMLLGEIAHGTISCSERFTDAPSPIAANIMRWHTHVHMYEDDTPDTKERSRLRDDILREVVFSSELRPRLPRDRLEKFRDKLQRLYPGYTPASSAELFEWIRERIVIPENEWEKLLSGMRRDHGLESSQILEDLSQRLTRVRLPNAKSVVTAMETLPRLLRSLFVPGTDGEDRLYEILEEWLRFDGPVKLDLIHEVFGIDDERIRRNLETLLEGQSIVVDMITEDAVQPEVCDTENLERFLRLFRREMKKPFRALEACFLPLFLARYQGIVPQKIFREKEEDLIRGGAVEGDQLTNLQDSLEILFGYPARAELWESEILPARLSPYAPESLDLILQQSGLMWFGVGKERLSFCFEEERELFLQSNRKAIKDIERIFPEPTGKYNFWDLHSYSTLSTQELTQKLWELVWKGLVSNDQFSVIRRGIEHKFKVFVPEPKAPGRRSTRSQFNRWQRTRPLPGNWYVVDRNIEKGDLIEEEELVRDRVRQLLRRYGILFRELLAQELPGLRWGRIFRSLRIMELSGEILAGHFFLGISGLQFVSHTAFGELQQKQNENVIYWLNATDPASPCGLKIEGLNAELPRRISTNYLVFHGKKLVVILRKGGVELEILVSHKGQDLQQYLNVYSALLERQFQPHQQIRVEKINGEPALGSRYTDQLLQFGFSRGHRELMIRREYR
jgi:ATP-dependent Lhr-like helicase